MKLIEKLENYYNSGMMSDGLEVHIDRSTHGNWYNYFIKTPDGERENIFSGKWMDGARKIEKFAKEKNIEITEPDKKPYMWEGAERSKMPYNPTEQPPSFKSKW